MRLFYVAGMHRSGTSATTRVLNLLGASLGPEAALMPAQPDNRTGFWEPLALARFNERLLRAYGGSWSDPPRFRAGWADDPDVEPWIEEASRLLSDVVSDRADVHAVKDPRLSLTLPLWLRVRRPARVVLPLREPSAVCQSLERRNGIDHRTSAALWVRYVSSVLDAVPDPLVVYYRSLLTDTDAVIEELCAALDLPAPDPAARRAILDFCDPGFDHAEPPNGAVDGELGEASSLYERLRD
jgi:hypothetical protein